MSKWQARLTGTGGQGLITAGIILAEAAIIDGKEAIQSQSYGPEARGGASKAEVIISNETINYPKVTTPDLVLCMSPESYEKYSSNISENGILVIDSSQIPDIREDNTKKIFVPITKIAREEVGKVIASNIVALGAVAGASQIVSFESLKEAILRRIPKGTEEMNTKALELGWDYVKQG